MNVYEAAKSISIIEVYEHYTGNKIPTFRKARNVSCPFHGADKNPSMHLYTKDNSFHCFACGEHGSTIDFVMKIKNYTEPLDAAEELCRTFNVEYEEKKECSFGPEYITYTKIFTKLANLFNLSLHSKNCPNPNYFKERGLSDKTINDNLLGYCPENLQFDVTKDLTYLKACGLSNSLGRCPLAGRYIFPIKNPRGDIVGFAGRSLTDKTYKYINTPETSIFQKGHLLYNFHEAKKYPRIVVVEGYMDALSLIELGVPNVVALMGVALTNYQVAMLQGKELILALDSDKTGQQRTSEIIFNNKKIKFQVIPVMPYKDINECLMNMRPDLVLGMLEKTISAPEFIIRKGKEEEDLSSLYGRERLWRRLATLIGSNAKEYQEQYPINTAYTPVAIDYYWTIVKRIIKGRRTK